MAGTALKAIETVYNGYRFRSRLEARWAVFYDHMGVEYQYEPQGFDLDGLWYLPDFWLPQQQCWIEIKPQKPEAAESRKAEALALAADCNVYVCYGEIPYPSPSDSGADSAEVWGPVCAEDGSRAAWWDDSQWWTHCTRCGAIDLHYCGAEDRLGGECAHSGGPATPHLRAAYLAARQARFEHGEAPHFAPPPGPPQRLTTDTIHDIDNLIWAYCTRFQTWHTAHAIADAIGRHRRIVHRHVERLVEQGTLRRDIATDRTTVYSVGSPFDHPTLG